MAEFEKKNMTEMKSQDTNLLKAQRDCKKFSEDNAKLF